MLDTPVGMFMTSSAAVISTPRSCTHSGRTRLMPPRASHHSSTHAQQSPATEGITSSTVLVCSPTPISRASRSTPSSRPLSSSQLPPPPGCLAGRAPAQASPPQMCGTAATLAGLRHRPPHATPGHARTSKREHPRRPSVLVTKGAAQTYLGARYLGVLAVRPRVATGVALDRLVLDPLEDARAAERVPARGDCNHSAMCFWLSAALRLSSRSRREPAGLHRGPRGELS